jgi:hypothetical protein
MGEPGCVIFLTKNGDEYLIGEEGTDGTLDDIVKLFPKVYAAYKNREDERKDAYGYTVVGRWKIMPEFSGTFFVRTDYFEPFYTIFQKERGYDKEFPLSAARTLLGREHCGPDEKMIYRKTQEFLEKESQEAARVKREVEENRLSDTDVPWMKYKTHILEGYIKFFIRKHSDGTLSGFRWSIQVQKEQYEEGSYQLDAPIECYNLFVRKYENVDEKILEDFDEFYSTYITANRAGTFIRSYKTLEKAKEAVGIRNEWIGCGNVNRKNIYWIDYERLKSRIESDSQIFIF